MVISMVCVVCSVILCSIPLLMCTIPTMLFSHKLELDICKTELMNGLELNSHTVLAILIRIS